jgi:ubiquinone/menaquinone biosynthesis C-methylase UbiE
MIQRLDEWTKNYNDDYFNRQFKTPYRSTIKFCDWLEQIGVLTMQSNCNIMDIGTGKGSNIYYMSERFPNCQYLGLDINNNFIKEGNTFFEKENINSCKLEYGDLYNLDIKKHANRFEGIISYQTLSWLPEYEGALTEIVKLNPNWIALTSLFFDGLINCKVEIEEFKNLEEKNGFKTAFYNVYSLPRIERFFFEKGYKLFKYCPFEIDIDLPKPEHSHMQTYTEKLIDGKRLQISGPLLMNWFFIYAEKI